jgi:NAD(P)-dependent dehydrogenase (short-subunit alcohol dehydrogenase family)
MNVNLMGAVRFIEAFLPKMVAQRGGNVVLMSSVSGLAASRMNAPYCASKSALISLAGVMAKDYGAEDIVTVALCPGYVETEMTARSIQKRVQLKGMTPEQARDAIVKINPQHRIIPAEEIAEMAAFVCSGKVPSLSGSAIVLSGGV